MSRLEELIAELCPDGVKYDTLDFCTRKTYNIKWKNEKKSFQYIDLSSVDRDTHEIIETIEIDSTTAPSRAQQIIEDGDILFGSTRPLLNRYCQINKNYHNQICSTGFCVLRPDIKKVNIRWIYHFLSSSSFIDHVKTYQQGASYPAITDSDIKKYKIPVPPLPIQEEIVRILDSFTELTAELTAELTKRKEQYQYYCDLLLTFDKKYEASLTTLKCVTWANIGNICDISRGRVISKEYIENNSGIYPVYSSQTENNGLLGSISTYMYNGEYLTWTTDGANAGTIFYRIGKFNITNVCGLLKLKDKNILTKYLYYVLGKLAKTYVNYGMGNPKLMSHMMAKISVPIPPLAEQARIVAILDRFDALCNDLTSGLPAEIEARKKQYEYYRDKLLTFKEAV